MKLVSDCALPERADSEGISHTLTALEFARDAVREPRHFVDHDNEEDQASQPEHFFNDLFVHAGKGIGSPGSAEECLNVPRQSWHRFGCSCIFCVQIMSYKTITLSLPVYE